MFVQSLSFLSFYLLLISYSAAAVLLKGSDLQGNDQVSLGERMQALLGQNVHNHAPNDRRHVTCQKTLTLNNTAVRTWNLPAQSYVDRPRDSTSCGK
jgi:anti-sigma factor ChrR (cupin superfamily)